MEGRVLSPVSGHRSQVAGALAPPLGAKSRGLVPGVIAVTVIAAPQREGRHRALGRDVAAAPAGDVWPGAGAGPSPGRARGARVRPSELRGFHKYPTLLLRLTAPPRKGKWARLPGINPARPWARAGGSAHGPRVQPRGEGAQSEPPAWVPPASRVTSGEFPVPRRA